MRLTICAIGRTRGGPERDLVDDYLSRAERSGKSVGITRVSLVEAEARGQSSPQAEAPLLRRAVPEAAVLVCLDERGKILTSPRFAERIGAWRDTGHRDVAFLIGGADGLEPSLRDEADLSLSFGPMVWPHLLARVMLAEQLYRAVSILTGKPYHRE